MIEPQPAVSVDRLGRTNNLARILEERRLAVLEDVRQGLRESRGGGAIDRADGVQDSADSGEISFQDDIRVALMNMKSETLARINDALARLADGRYGCCEDCGHEMSEARLRAMPFAIRCTACEAGRENAESLRLRGDRLMKRLKQYATDEHQRA